MNEIYNYLKVNKDIHFKKVVLNDNKSSLFLSSKFLVKFCIFFMLNNYCFGQITIARQDFETSPASPVLTFSNTLGTIGSVTPGSPAGATTVFAGSRGYYFSGSVVGPAVFTSNADVDTRCYSNPSLTFKLAALANNGAQGLDAPDIVTVAISTNGGTSFTDELRVAGRSNAVWSYTGGTASASSAYDGNGTVEAIKTFSPTNGGVRTTDGYSTITLTGLPKISNLRVRITLLNDSGNETWAIDNVVINNATVASTPTTPTFNSVAPICSGGSLSALPTTSNNSITGTWSPALNNLATTTYTFTPTATLCATSTTLTITVNPNITPTFNSVAPICSGGSLSALPTTSNNGFTGTWSPALDNLTTTTYTFTPTAGQCATTTTLTITVIPNVTYYQDFDGDGFGNPTITQLSCTGTPSGYVTNNSDCNDNQIQYADIDGDGFGSTTQVACGVTNNIDCNDNQTQYLDFDGDGFGSTTQVACGVTNNIDCNDNQIQYADIDGDGFGSTTQVACGVINNSDCNDFSLLYEDLDGDGYGSLIILACGGVSNNFDCDDNQIHYLDTDGDGFGFSSIVPCGVANNTDCFPTLLTYQDIDGDGFGSTTQVACGVTNNSDCNDNQIQYADIDGDGFGSTTQVACGVANNTDCFPTLLTYQDIDGDGFGSTTQVACGVTNNTDCNDNQIQYLDFDGDGFGSNTQVACGVTNNTDCNDNDNLVYQSALLYNDVDGDGYNIGSAVTCYGATLPTGTSLTTLGSGDCNDANAAINPGAIDVCYDGIDNDCNGIIDNACTPITSVIQSSQCGTILPLINSYIYANVVSGAQGYRFRVTDMTDMSVQTIDRALRVFQLTQLTSYAFNRTYQVEVSIRINNVWQPFYGLPCNVTTPATTTQVQTAQCGSTLTNMNDVVFADNTPFATGYAFRVTNLISSAQVVLIRPIRDFKMSLISGVEYNATYSVEVAVKNTNGTYLPYGTLCNITTPSFPSSQLQTSQCDAPAVASMNTTIYADSYSGATAYRFKFVNTVLGYTYTFDRPIRSFVLSTVPGLLAGTTYSVQVAIQLGGVFGPFGKICSLSTPETGKVAQTIAFKSVAFPNPFSDSFMINVTTSSQELVQIKVYDMLGKLVEVRQVNTTAIADQEIGNNYPTGIYNVIVSQGDNNQTLRMIKR